MMFFLAAADSIREARLEAHTAATTGEELIAARVDDLATRTLLRDMLRKVPATTLARATTSTDPSFVHLVAGMAVTILQGAASDHHGA